MANPLKGEVTVRVSTGEFTLAYNFGTAAAIEADFGKPISAIIEDLQASQSATDTLRLLHHGLRKHHNMSMEQAGEVITMAEAAIWGAALGRAFSDPDAKEEDAAARPPAAKGSG